MKLKYYYEDEPVFENDSDDSPRIGEMVYLDEIFFVENVIWYPRLAEIRVYLSDRQTPIRKPVAERKENVVNLNEVRQIKETAEKALKESISLKREVITIRQYLRSQPKVPKNDT